MARRLNGYLIASLIVLGVTVAAHVQCLSYCVWARGWSIPLPVILLLASTLVAPVSFLVAHLCRVRPRWRRHVEALLVSFGVLAVVWTVGVAVCFIRLWSLGIVITNPARYEELRGMVQPSSHFPERIPGHARRVRFSYYPGPLQSASHLQLRMKLPPEEIEAVVDRARQQGVMEYHGGGQAPDGRPTTAFFTSDSAQGIASPDQIPFPPSYLILQFGEPRRWEPGTWNHGAIGGIAVDEDAREVVYWAQSW